MLRNSESDTAPRERPASESRRTSVEPPTASGARAEGVRAAQVRAVGAGFLRARPLVVAPVAQRVALTVAIASLVLFFVVERAVLARRDIGADWLLRSLGLTTVGLAGGAALSGGVESPLLPLLLAPVVVSFAAFGRKPRT